MRQLVSPHRQVLTGEDARGFAAVMRVLGDPVRVEIVSRLLNSPGGFTVVELARLVGLSQPAMTHQTKILVGAGFIVRQRATHPYTVVPGVLAYVASFLGGSR